MKLLNYTSAYFALMMLLVIAVWAAIFYYNMLDEIYDSIDDGLENSKMLIIERAAEDPSIFYRNNFLEANYAIHETDATSAIDTQDYYKDTTMYMINEEDYEPVRMLKTAFLQDGKYYSLQIITSMVEEDDLIEDLLFSIVWLYIILIIIIILLNNLLLKRIWQPFYQLLEKLKNFRLDRPAEVTVQASPIQEFNELHQATLTLLRSNVAAYNQQKQFIENASHELQTPLAISMNKLELLIGNENLTEKQLEYLAGVVANLERMNRMNRSLLLLSKIDNHQFADEQAVAFDALIAGMLPDFQDQANFKQVRLSLAIRASCRHLMNPDLARMLLTNLLKNAIFHNIPGGEVVIQVDKNLLGITNTGPGEALPADKMFNRFYKQSNKPQSTGLGLAIVKSITDLYGYQVTYMFDGRHNMTVNF